MSEITHIESSIECPYCNSPFWQWIDYLGENDDHSHNDLLHCQTCDQSFMVVMKTAPFPEMVAFESKPLN